MLRREANYENSDRSVVDSERGGTSFAQDLGWPREEYAGSKLIYYQPQLDNWKDFRQLEARMVVSLTPAGGQPEAGVLYLPDRTDANLETRNVKHAVYESAAILPSAQKYDNERCSAKVEKSSVSVLPSGIRS